MALRSTGLAAAHPALRAYAARHGIADTAFRADGGVTLTVDERYRVQLRPASEGRIALGSALMDLGERSASEVDAALQRLATWGAGLLRDHSSTLAIDEARQQLMLQQLVPAGSDVTALESELADFVNVLAFWTRTSAGVTAARA